MLKIAVPLAGGRLCMHFGHCQEFAFLEVDETAGKILKFETLTPPPHEPGVIPRWIAEQGAAVVIAGGMGAMAQELLTGRGVEVITGASPLPPEVLAAGYLAGTLASGENVCDHDHGSDHNCGH